MPAVPDVPGVPSAEELAALPRAELAVRLAEAYRLIGELSAQVERLSARMEELERRGRRDSSTSSRPPSSDSPYKKSKDRSLRERGKRRPGRQPGEPGTTMMLVDHPDVRFCIRLRRAGSAARTWPPSRWRHSVAIRSPTSSRPRRRR